MLKAYTEKYRAAGPVHLVGVEFSKETRNIVGFETRSETELQSVG